MLQQIKKWTYNGVEYDTEKKAALAAITHKLDLSLNGSEQASLDEKVEANAGDLINLLSVFARKATRS